MRLIKREILHYVKNEKSVFQEWILSLKDVSARALILKHIKRIEEGFFGDHRSVGDGVFEIRIHLSPGFRIYYFEDGTRIVILLCGGIKKDQKKDILKAKNFKQDYLGGK